MSLIPSPALAQDDSQHALNVQTSIKSATLAQGPVFDPLGSPLLNAGNLPRSEDGAEGASTGSLINHVVSHIIHHITFHISHSIDMVRWFRRTGSECA